MRVFLDVGGHRGQTLRALLEPAHGFPWLFCGYDFDRIYCFEPVRRLFEEISTTYSREPFRILNLGLWNRDCSRAVFSAGSQSGSIWPDKVNVDLADSEVCRFVSAARWFRENIAESDRVFLKINCEGCEVDILDDLLDSGEFRKVASVGVTFDVRKIPSLRHREAELQARLQSASLRNVVDLNSLPAASHREMIRSWLDRTAATRPRWSHRVKRAGFSLWVFGARAVRYSRKTVAAVFARQPWQPLT